MFVFLHPLVLGLLLFGNVGLLLGCQFLFVRPYPYLQRFHEVDLSDFNALKYI